ncbi:MAG: bifunctional demethylmenaquinone methyltransferase/2-methoxy-6-polyprenyl-1,4-benzoquinol methylase [Rhodospirillaceae bacterium]|nr:bifunctional demethylmenaquinone methyltransferase/2-methoxy-6-polyprenyl-1,4-benzoquinol methylase [Rhodospirillaceae bacterium]|tara:strand:+ start:21342 stop:22133 length:792 start_codon:yes stop_codon:yes gene_type:complete
MANTSSNGTKGNAETDFGFQRVSKEEHSGLVAGVFDSVADRYDLMNDLMSGGLHRIWKQSLIDWIKPRPTTRLVDVAGGTGDVTFRFLERLNDLTNDQRPQIATICDPNAAMLQVARERALDKGYVGDIEFLEAPAEALPLPDRSADVCTISFGLRNVTDRAAGLAEMHRILEIGGHFLCLEFSPAIVPVLAPLYEAYSDRILPWLGEHIAGDREAYEYLVESIRRFPEPDALATEMAAAGFKNIKCRSMSGGIVAIHSGWRV